MHKAKDYPEARDGGAALSGFLSRVTEDAPYALYLMALSPITTRSTMSAEIRGITFQALQGMRDVIETYPDSEYARSAILKFDLAFDQLAAKEMEVGRYYLKRGHYTLRRSTGSASVVERISRRPRIRQKPCTGWSNLTLVWA